VFYSLLEDKILLHTSVIIEIPFEHFVTEATKIVKVKVVTAVLQNIHKSEDGTSIGKKDSSNCIVIRYAS